jgi:hypothetical protein
MRVTSANVRLGQQSGQVDAAQPSRARHGGTSGVTLTLTLKPMIRAGSRDRRRPRCPPRKRLLPIPFILTTSAGISGLCGKGPYFRFSCVRLIFDPSQFQRCNEPVRLAIGASGHHEGAYVASP